MSDEFARTGKRIWHREGREMTTIDRRCPVEPENRAFTDAALPALRACGWSPSGWVHFLREITLRSAKQIA